MCMCFLYSDTCGLISNQEIHEVGQKFIRIKCKNGNCICLSQHQCYDVNAFCSAMYIRNNALRFQSEQKWHRSMRMWNILETTRWNSVYCCLICIEDKEAPNIILLSTWTTKKLLPNLGWSHTHNTLFYCYQTSSFKYKIDQRTESGK